MEKNSLKKALKFQKTRILNVTLVTSILSPLGLYAALTLGTPLLAVCFFALIGLCMFTIAITV